MRVLVTGAAGFIGTHLCRVLVADGMEVTGFDRTEGCELAEPGLFDQAMNETSPDLVVHLAALVGRLHGEDDVFETVRENVAVTCLVAKACADYGVPLVYASTSEIYGDQGKRACVEDGLLTLPHNLYGLSKRWGEEVCRLYAPDDLIILRPNMPYGPGVPAGRGRAAILNYLDWARKGERIIVHRGSERSWCWIGDTVDGIRLILRNGEPGVFNVGRDDNPTLMVDVARIACELTGANQKLIKEVDPPRMVSPVKRLSSLRLRQLGWLPTVDLREGMRRTLEAL